MPELYHCGACAQQRPPHKFRAKSLYEFERGRLKAKDLKCTECTVKQGKGSKPQPVTGTKRATPSSALAVDKRQRILSDVVPVAAQSQQQSTAADKARILAVNQQTTRDVRCGLQGKT